ILAMAGEIWITDWEEGSGVHKIRGIIASPPDEHIEKLNEKGFKLKSPGGLTAELVIDGPAEATATTGRIALGFGFTVPRPLIEWRWRGTLPISVETRFGSGGLTTEAALFHE